MTFMSYKLSWLAFSVFVLRSLMWLVTSWDYMIWESCDFIMSSASPHVSALPCLVAICLLEEEIFRFSLSRDLTWPRGQRDICIHLTISQQLAKIRGHRPCGRGDLNFSICYLTSHDHLIRLSSDIMDEFASS